MRDYLKEIDIIKKEVEEINERLIELVYEKTSILVACAPVISNKGSLIAAIKNKESDDTIDIVYRLLNRLDEVKEEIYLLHMNKEGKLKTIDALKKEYIENHTEDFYRPMDEIDIRNLINKNGYIIGVKF